MRKPPFLAAAPYVVAAIALSCTPAPPATDADCRTLVDRLVDAELRDRGLDDPALAARWRASAQSRFEAEIAACRGRPLPPGALGCARRAASPEEIAHACLR